MTCCFSRRSLEVRRLPGRPAIKRICGYIPGLPSAAGLRKLAARHLPATVDHLDLRIRVDRVGDAGPL
jgi:hypothetical protein